MRSESHPAAPLSRPLENWWRTWLAAFALAFILYAATADRGVQWQDSGWQQVRIVTGQIDHPMGLALAHPVQHYLGRAAVWLLPIEPAFAITLVSCLAAAIAVANLAAVILILTRRLSAVFVATAALALSHTFWQHATHTESYAIVAALLTGEWLCLAHYATTGRSRFLLLLAFLNGLGVANHLLASLAIPVDIAVIVPAARSRRLSGGGVVLAVLLWLVGTLPFSLLVFGLFLRTGDFLSTAHSALFGKFAGNVLNVHVGLRTVAFVLGYLLYNFPGLTIPLALHALVRRIDVPKLFLRAVKWELLLYGLFVARYTIKDQYTFFFPIYALLALLAGLGLADFLSTSSFTRRRLVFALALLTSLWTPLIYTGAAKILRARGAFAAMVGNKPYRDGYEFFFTPWGMDEKHATLVNQNAYRLAGPDGLIVYDEDTIGVALRYAHALNRPPTQVTVAQIEISAPADVVARWRDRLRSYLAAGRSVVLVPHDRDRPVTCIPDARWKRDGDLYVLTEIAPDPA